MKPKFTLPSPAKARRLFEGMVRGGDWALTQTHEARHNMYWFWFDGFFASASDNIVITYLTLYLLALGATRAQIGLFSSLSMLSAALLLMPGAMLVERLGRRRELSLLGGSWARLALVLLALLPLIVSREALVPAAILFAVSRDAMNNLAFPAWMSLTGDIVPIEGRGRFFASRNFAMGLSGIAVTLLAGELITRAVQPQGYQIAMVIAFALGLCSTFSFSRLKDPLGRAIPKNGTSLALPALWRDLRAHPAFLTLAATAALWNFSLNIAGPFFNVYLVENMKASAAMVGLTTIASTVANMFIQRWIGPVADRIGPRRLQLISGLLIPVLPVAWMFITAAWQVIPINLVSGVLWGTYGLASFNFLLILTPEAQRARYSAVYQMVVTGSLAVGAAVGGLVVTAWGYPVLFLASGVGRFAAALLFARFVHTPEPEARPALPPGEALGAELPTELSTD